MNWASGHTLSRLTLESNIITQGFPNYTPTQANPTRRKADLVKETVFRFISHMSMSKILKTSLANKSV